VLARIARRGHRHTRQRRAERRSPASPVPARSTAARCNECSPFCSCGDVTCLSNVSTLVLDGPRSGAPNLTPGCQRGRRESSTSGLDRLPVTACAGIVPRLETRAYAPRKASVRLICRDECRVSAVMSARHGPSRLRLPVLRLVEQPGRDATCFRGAFGAGAPVSRQRLPQNIPNRPDDGYF
jgi:hypothetical protein